MKKFLSGFLCAVLVFGLAVSALAASGALTISASLNSVNIEVNGVRQAAVGESYTLANGKDTAKTIVYNETTYVPIRYFGELMDVAIGWNQDTSSVTIGEAPAEPDTATVPDYSDWSAEDEAAYQEFKGMWEVGKKEWSDTSNSLSVTVRSTQPIDNDEFNKTHNVDMLCKQFALEQYENEDSLVVVFVSNVVLKIVGVRIDGGKLVVSP